MTLRKRAPVDDLHSQVAKQPRISQSSSDNESKHAVNQSVNQQTATWPPPSQDVVLVETPATTARIEAMMVQVLAIVADHTAQIAKHSTQIATITTQIVEHTAQIAKHTTQIAKQSTQIAELMVRSEV